MKAKDSIKITKEDVKKIFKKKKDSHLTVHVVMRPMVGLIGSVLVEICSTSAKAESYVKKHKNPSHIFTINTYKVR